MNLVRAFLAFSAVLLCACDKSPEVTTGSSNAEGKVEPKVGSEIDGIDVSKLEGWAELSSDGRAAVADFVREARALDAEWLELQRAMNAASEPKQFVAALNRFTAALSEWLPGYLKAGENLRMFDGLRNAEEYLFAQLQSKGPDLSAIVGKVGEVYERFSEDQEVRASTQKLIPVVEVLNFRHSLCR
ncbi:MAG: hypothetical protein V4819_20730 [Verrucomicrobiota bacterium]